MGTDETKLVHPGEIFNQCVDSYREQLHQISITIRSDIQTSDQNQKMQEDFSELKKILKFCWPTSPTPQTCPGLSLWNPASRMTYIGLAFNRAVCESYESWQWINCFTDISRAATLPQTKAFLEEMDFVNRETDYLSYQKVAVLMWLAASQHPDWRLSPEAIKDANMIWLADDLRVVFSYSRLTKIPDILQKAYETLDEKAKDQFLTLLYRSFHKAVIKNKSNQWWELKPEVIEWLNQLQTKNPSEKIFEILSRLSSLDEKKCGVNTQFSSQPSSIDENETAYFPLHEEMCLTNEQY